jgi:two-component system response regulator HydG
MPGRILIIDDDRTICDVLEAELTARGFEVTCVGTADAGLRLLEERDFDLVLTDINMPRMTGVDLCQKIVDNREDVPVIVMTGFGSMETAVLAIRAGAYDYVTKPLEIESLTLTLERALRDGDLRQEVKRLRTAAGAQSFDEIVGTSPPITAMFDLISRVADSDTSVLVTGESGTGKELVARALHNTSLRKEGPFVAINCAAMPESLLESELFGHVKGAFTDARQSRAGLFVTATNGTLLLDEIGEMPMGMQAKLLRALQERRVRPVGGNTEVPFDTRILAATNRDLDREVEEGRFREDLFYRINVVRLEVPPLRARGDDVLQIARYYLKRYAAQGRSRVIGITASAAQKLAVYPWPGNVRELSNCIERAVALTRLDHIDIADLPEKVRDFRPTRVVVESDDPTELLTMDEVARRYILRVLQSAGGNKTLAARILGFDRRTLYRKLDAYAAGTRATSAAPDGRAAVHDADSRVGA